MQAPVIKAKNNTLPDCPAGHWDSARCISLTVGTPFTHRFLQSQRTQKDIAQAHSAKGNRDMMNKTQVFKAALAGEDVDYVPSGYWLHFPEELWFGDAAIKAHLDFYKDVDPDILKVMNEYRYRMDTPIADPSDWAKWKPLRTRGGYYDGQMDIIKGVADKLAGEVPIMATIHGVYICAFHGGRRPEATFDQPHVLTQHLKECPEAVLPALQAVTDSLIELALSSLEAGADGIYYSSIGGEMSRFDEETFTRYIKPFEVQFLEEVGKHTDQVILHVCKSQPRLAPYADYPANAVNWAEHDSDTTLEAGRALFGKTVLGGLESHHGVLLNGSEVEITEAVQKRINDFGRKSFVLGADCTLPTEISPARIRQAVDAARR